MPLRIALDLDNTLIHYGSLFHRLALERGWISAATSPTKRAVRAAVVEGEDDHRWQLLQALAYGPEIAGATIAPGAVAFIDQARAAGHQVFILSHKTERSHADPSVALRDHARRWLDQAGLVGDARIPHSAIRFFDARATKARAVADLAIDWLIDDLREVLEHPAVPDRTLRVWLAPESSGDDLFVRCGSFVEISVLLQLHDELGIEPTPALRRALGRSPRSLQRLDGGGNTTLRIVADDDGSRCVVKGYSRRGGGRAERERRALNWLHDVGLNAVPRSRYVDTTRGVAVLDYVAGTRPHPTMAERMADECARFIAQIVERRTAAEARAAFGPASDARFTLASYRLAVERRLGQLVASASSSRVEPFIRDEVAPLVGREIAAFERRLRSSGLSSDEPLDARLRIPSPSDFGLHNMILDRYDRVWFVDFEYFGWDDPAKLMADFRHSVANTMPAPARERFVERVLGALDDDPGARQRLAVVSDLVRAEWILIVLNELSAERVGRARAMVEAIG